MRKLAVAGLVFVSLAGAVVACSSGTDVESDGGDSTDEVVAEYALPFGLDQVEGTVPVARPVVAEQVTALYDGQPVNATSFEPPTG